MNVPGSAPRRVSVQGLTRLLAATAVLALLTPAGTLAAPPVFAPSEHYSSNQKPNDIATADLDLDGDLDIVLNDGSVFLGSGKGKFGWVSSVVEPARGVALADVSGDTLPDLVATACASDELLVYRGLGNGDFDSPDTYTGFNCPGPLGIADLDGDGVLDVVVINFGAANIEVLLGQGGGYLKPIGTVSPTPDPSDLAVGDVDGDGIPDVVVTDGQWSEVSILIGLGTGSFAKPVKFAIGNNPRPVIIEDLDANGIVDLAVANTGSPEVSVMLGSGSGGFNNPVDYFGGGESLLAADMNGDGTVDLVAGNQSFVNVLLGNGGGVFAKPTRYDLNTTCFQPGIAAGPVGSGVVVGDFYPDGKLDLALTVYLGHGMSVLLQQ